MPAMLMQHDEDPANVLMKALAGVELDKQVVYNNQVLVAIYKRPEKTKSNVLLPEKYREEEQWQGKAGLVVKKGMTAYRPDLERGWFLEPESEKPQVGDWIMI